MFFCCRFCCRQVLEANNDDDSVVTNKLDEAIIARVLRVNVLDWNTYGMVCMRLEIYGCDTKEGEIEYNSE